MGAWTEAEREWSERRRAREAQIGAVYKIISTYHRPISNSALGAEKPWGTHSIFLSKCQN